MDFEFKNTFIRQWKKYFAGAPLPVAFFFSDELHCAQPARKFSGHHCLITDFISAWKGKSLAFDINNIGCAGGKRYCGFADTLRPDFGYFLSYGIEGKVEGERYKKDPETVEELMRKNPKIDHKAKWMIVKPFELLEVGDEPEAIIFFATPDVVAGLFTLANYDRTDLYGVKSPFSAGCGTLVQYPYLENRSNKPDCILGMFDSSARPYVPSGTLSFAIPMKRFEVLVGYMDESFLITGTWKVMQKRIKNDL